MALSVTTTNGVWIRLQYGDDAKAEFAAARTDIGIAAAQRTGIKGNVRSRLPRYVCRMVPSRAHQMISEALPLKSIDRARIHTFAMSNDVISEPVREQIESADHL